ncbi:MAG: hypothetical protein ACE5MB_12165, partial [Anaerolineae bacterium]
RGVAGLWLGGAGIGLVGLMLTLPWLLRLLANLRARGTLLPYLPLEAAYYALPHDLLAVPHNRELAIVAAWGLLWGLLRRERAVVIIGLWVLSLFLMANPGLLGLPHTPLVNNSALVISLFLPLAILCGYLVASLYQVLESRLDVGGRSRARYALGGLIALVALWGAWSMLSIVNPVTILATRDDVAAMAWIREHTSPGAKFLINARPWQGGIYVGSDGGYWIPLLAERGTSLPPALYVFGPPEYVQRVNELARLAVSGTSLDSQEVRWLLRGEGITHVYLGTRGGRINPQALLSSPHYRLVYVNGAVRVFEVVK